VPALLSTATRCRPAASEDGIVTEIVPSAATVRVPRAVGVE
jgi:hypothetical protein